MYAYIHMCVWLHEQGLCLHMGVESSRVCRSMCTDQHVCVCVKVPVHMRVCRSVCTPTGLCAHICGAR